MQIARACAPHRYNTGAHKMYDECYEKYEGTGGIRSVACVQDRYSIGPRPVGMTKSWRVEKNACAGRACVLHWCNTGESSTYMMKTMKAWVAKADAHASNLVPAGSS